MSHVASSREGTRSSPDLERIAQAEKADSLRHMAERTGHDYGNLLGAILANADLALRHVPPDSPAAANVRLIRTIVAQAIDLTRQIMTFGGRAPLDLAPVALSDLVRSIEPDVRQEVPARVRLLLDLAPDLPKPNIDAARAREAILNLVRNAATAVSDRDGTITVATGIALDRDPLLQEAYLQDRYVPRPGEAVFIDVRDDGCGMPPERSRRVFDPFFSTHIRNQGLGLSVAVGILRAHGGTICMRSAPEQGSVFRALFPIPART